MSFVVLISLTIFIFGTPLVIVALSWLESRGINGKQKEKKERGGAGSG